LADPLKEFFGDLYWHSTHEFLTPALTRAEVDLFVGACRPRPESRIVDVGCGHGRHLGELNERGFRFLVGTDFQLQYLRWARGNAPDAAAVASDHRALALRTGCADIVASFYSSLFYFDLGGNARTLSEIARILRPGGRFFLAASNPARLRRAPRSVTTHPLAGGAGVSERSEFDPERGIETTRRRIVFADGRTLEGGYAQRHHTPDELETLGATVGLRLDHVCASPTGQPLGNESPELAAVFTRISLGAS
jgi:SAM-dependent methyltransferase